MPSRFEGRYFPRGEVNSFGQGGSDPLDSAIDFTLLVDSNRGYIGRYLGTSKAIPERICREIEQAIMAIRYGEKKTKPLRTTPFVVLNQIRVGDK